MWEKLKRMINDNVRDDVRDRLGMTLGFFRIPNVVRMPVCRAVPKEIRPQTLGLAKKLKMKDDDTLRVTHRYITTNHQLPYE